MNALRVVPLVVSALLLGAHFYRSGGIVIAILVALSPLLLLARRPWAIIALQLGLFVAAAEWIRTAAVIASYRASAGMPSTRMFLILGTVAVFTALSAVPLTTVDR